MVLEYNCYIIFVCEAIMFVAFMNHQNEIFTSLPIAGYQMDVSFYLCVAE